MPKIDYETIWANVPPSALHSTPTHFYSADKRQTLSSVKSAFLIG